MLNPVFGSNATQPPGTDISIVYGANISLQFFASMCDMAIATVMLEKSEVATAGTDYTIQTSLIYLSAILSMVIGGSISESLGYQGLLFVAAELSLLSVILVQKWSGGNKQLRIEGSK